MPNCLPLLNEGLAEIRQKVREAPGLSLFLDFDGTLAQIVEDPTQAELEEPTRGLLKDLARRPDVLTAIISGRALADLQPRVGIDEIVCAGNHGMEISGEGVHFVEPFAAATQGLLSKISRSLAEDLSAIPGVRLENKGLTASVHYRRASPDHVRDIELIVSRVVAPGVSPFFLKPGKMVLEIVPRSHWDKGAAVCWINSRLAHRGAVSIYVGDDRTDDTAFRQLSDEITVYVGGGAWTAARFHVPDPDGVCEFLLWLTQNRRGPMTAGGAIDDNGES